MNIQYGGIQHWPGRLRPAGERTKAPFKADHTGTLKLLERELRLISAEGVVVQLALQPGQFTRDGRPFYKSAPAHPGVVVSFAKPVRLPGEPKPRKVPLAFPADRFDTWETNLRAVAIALEDLRRIDRYGVTSTSEQYTGFKALPGPLHHMPTMTADEAATFVAVEAAPLARQITDPDLRVRAAAAGASGVLRERELYDALYRMAAKRLHPDVAGREPVAAAKWEKLAEAKLLLDGVHSPGGRR